MLEFNATFFVAMFSFIIFMLIMNSILYKPLSKIAEQRDNLIRGNYSDVETTNCKIEDLNNQHKENIEKTKTLAREQFDKEVDNYKLQKEVILDKAKTLAKKDLAIAQAELEGEEKTAKIILKSRILNFASLISSKLLHEKVEIQNVNEEIINSYLD
jgi:F-type H+-transporting ATPase subunit b